MSIPSRQMKNLIIYILNEKIVYDDDSTIIS